SQRLLVERQDLSAVTALRKMAKRGRTPQARLHALWTLTVLNNLTDEDVLAALKDQSAGVRENAVKLAKPRSVERDLLVAPRRAETPRPTARDLPGPLLSLASDPTPRVRFQLALVLGEIADPRALDALATIAA